MALLSRRLLLTSSFAIAAAVALPGAGIAQPAWPTDPVRIVVTFTPGGTSDIVARLLAQYMSEDLGQQVIVDNRPGAGGTVGAQIVAEAAPDGLTLLMANNAPFTIAPTQFKKIPYDVMGDFTHIAYIGAATPALFVQPSLGAGDLASFIELAKTRSITYGSSGVGSITHILGEAVNISAGIKMVHIPYKGSAPAIQDYKAGVLASYYDMLPQNIPAIRAGEVTALAVAAPERMPQAPEVPTFREQGYDIVLENWLGISGPKGMDPALADTIRAAFDKAMARPEVVAKLGEWGIQTRAMTGTEYGDFVAAQIETWKPLIIAAGAQEQ